MKETSGNGYSKAEQLRLREASDRLCREYGLSVIEKLRKAPSRPVWLDEKTASLPATMSTVPMCGRQWSSAEPPTINTVSADTHVVITGTMTQNAITIKADGEKRSW